MVQARVGEDVAGLVQEQRQGGGGGVPGRGVGGPVREVAEEVREREEVRGADGLQLPAEDLGEEVGQRERRGVQELGKDGDFLGRGRGRCFL